MTPVARRARLRSTQVDTEFFEEARALGEFRERAAWVLLGEPGAGKTTTFTAEAEATQAVRVRVIDFIDEREFSENWHGKTLFLDGLDEVRGSTSGESVVRRVRQVLTRLGKPAFRIACRAADWYGSSDTQDLAQVVPDGKLDVLQLEPLRRADILEILRDTHQHSDPNGFMAEAERRGIAPLLQNPQMLELLVKAVHKDQWPKTRDDTFRLACETLAAEHNKVHRDLRRRTPALPEQLLDAAGQLCAVLLLSDRSGVALDSETAGERFPVLDDCCPTEPEIAIKALASKLFRPDGEERVAPSHRSVTEYLASRWIARRIDSGGLPAPRVFNLLLGRDGRTVAGLRGLYAWLAVHSRTARSKLLDADPVTVLVYGDAVLLTTQDKQRLLVALRRDAERFGTSGWDYQLSQSLGVLATADMQGDLLKVLTCEVRDAASEQMTVSVCEAIAQGESMPELAPVLLGIVRDESRRPWVRQEALNAWLRQQTHGEAAIALLDELMDSKVADADDELSACLLRWLYPRHLRPERLLGYLHSPKRLNGIGLYRRFWHHEVAKLAPDDHLPILLDALVELRQRRPLPAREDDFHELCSGLLLRGLNAHGDQVSVEHLYTWLGVGQGRKWGERQGRAVSDWLGARPEHYKAVLAECFRQCEGTALPSRCVQAQARRLGDASVPNDLGLWHLLRATEASNDEVAGVHVRAAVQTLVNRKGDVGLSLEHLDAWAQVGSGRRQWLEAALVCWMGGWTNEQAEWDALALEEDAAQRQRHSALFDQHIKEIEAGTAQVDMLHQLADIWQGVTLGAHGEISEQRFQNFFVNGPELQAAAEHGFRRCVVLDDLPSVKDIIELSVRNQHPYILLPCLIGMALLWKDGPEEIDHLPESTLRRMIACHLVYGADETPDWVRHIVLGRPELFAEVLVAYARATLKSKRDYVDHIHPLQRDAEYAEVAALAVPKLLASFPTRAPTNRLRYLESLLKAAVRYAPDALKLMLPRKLGSKAMDAAQKTYWFAAATFLEPAQFENPLWRHIGDSESRAAYFAGFIEDDFGQPEWVGALSAGSIGRLVQVLAPNAPVHTSDVGGLVDRLERRGDQVRRLITSLGALATPEAEQEIERLMHRPALEKLQPLLKTARLHTALRRREREFRFLTPRQVSQVLANREPASTSDLAALALDHLEHIAYELQHDNDDGLNGFWELGSYGRAIRPRLENNCRDALLTRLRLRLYSVGVDCQPEGDYAYDKRADIRLSFGNEFEVPIEIKRDSNEQLWSAPTTQLRQYSRAPKASGQIIYLVLWFGGKGMPGARDGGRNPASPEELQRRLEAALEPIDRGSVHIAVLDLTRPGSHPSVVA